MVFVRPKRKFFTKTKKRRFIRRRTGFRSRRRYGVRRSIRRFRGRVTRVVRGLSEIKWCYFDGYRDLTAAVPYFRVPLGPGFSTGGAWSSSIPQGTGKGYRIGQLIRTKRITLQCNLGVISPDATPMRTFIKLSLVSFRGGEFSLTSLPSPSDVWEAANTADPITPFLSMYHSETVKVWKEWKFLLTNHEEFYTSLKSDVWFDFSIPYVATWRWDDFNTFRGDGTLLWLICQKYDDKVTLTNDFRFRARGRVSYTDI